MLHELLLTLYGNSQFMPTKNLLLNSCNCWQNEEATVKKFEEYFSFMHPSEKEIVKKIVKISLSYKKIEIFGDRYRFYTSCNSDTEPNRLHAGQYLTALATAIYEETKPYKKKILFLEELILNEPTTSLTSLLLGIQQFGSIFVEFGCLIDIVQEKFLHGCKILELIHFHAISTVGDYQKALKRVEKAILQVLYSQLTCWLLYGELLDPHNELFLKSASAEGDVPDTDDDVEALISFSTKGLETRRRLCVDVCLNLEMLPNFIDLDMAEMILFIGESIRFYEKEGNTEKENVLKFHCGHVLQKKEEEFLISFNKLSHDDGFYIKKFSELVESIRKFVSKRLYSLVTEAGLISELKNLKEIFLFGHGELYHHFFTLVEKSVKHPSNCISNLKLNFLFHKAGRQVFLDDGFLEKFIITFSGQSEQNNGTAWNNFQIDYKVQWPLHMIFNYKILEKYNSIHNFLFNVQRTQHRLQHLWVIQKEMKRSKLSENIELLCWTLRHHMSHLIYNFQLYIQVDVLESFYSQLMDEIETTDDYQHLSKAHMSYLTSIISHCLLTHPLLSSSVAAILDQIHLFCSLLESSTTIPSKEEIEKIKEDFDRISDKFFWGLTVLGQQRSCQYTVQLVAKIDYNHFYSKKSLATKFSNLDITSFNK